MLEISNHKPKELQEIERVINESVLKKPVLKFI